MKHFSEDAIQKIVVKFFLDLEESSGKFSFFGVIGGSVRVSPHIGKRMKDMGARCGVADLAFLMPVGKIVFIELKAMTGAMSPDQKHWHNIVSGLGFVSYCTKARTGEEAVCKILDILEAHGFAEGTKRPTTMKSIMDKYLEQV